jgi:hypothetical protein
MGTREKPTTLLGTHLQICKSNKGIPTKLSKGGHRTLGTSSRSRQRTAKVLELGLINDRGANRSF